MRLILIAFLLLPSVAFADYEATARQCRAACVKIPDEAKRVECTRKCPPLGYYDALPLKVVDWSEPAPVDDKPKAPAPKPAPPPKEKKPHAPDNDQFKCEGHTCPQPVDPTPHIILSAGPNAQHCTERRENCRNLDRLCRSGSGAACASAAKCWTKVNTDCGV